jgi:myo-inositol-1(or 4)-monophosphatase
MERDRTSPTEPDEHVTELPQQLLELASRLAVASGKMVREGRRHGVQSASTKSSVTDMVTEFDRASERLIVDGLTAARPDDAVIGEEGTDTNGASGIRWLIDPIDGTTNFLYDLPGYAVSIAALDGDRPLVGVVFVPSADELFTAVAGEGVFLNGEAIHCGTTASLDQALVATEMVPRIRDIRRLGAAATDLCHLAAGRVDVYFEQWLGPWDLAAGELIAREAGCRTGRFDGSPVDHHQVLACNPVLFDQMVELLAVTEPGRQPGIM